MRFLSLLLLVLFLSVPAAFGEDQDPKPGTASSSSSSGVKKDYPPVRRFSAGGYFGYSALQYIANGSATQTVTNTKGTVSGTATYATGPKGGHLGGGAVVQYAILNRFAVAGDILFKTEKYSSTSSTALAGKTSSTSSYSSASMIEIPVVARWYSKTRTEPGARYFIDAGPSFRYTHNVRTSTQSTDTAGVVTCCTDSADPLAHSFATGFAVGAGYQLVDQLGIHLIPRVRYTRWLQPGFNNLSTHTNSNQVEGGISITF